MSREGTDVNAVTMDSRDRDEWLGELSRRGWTTHYFPSREHPVAMAFTYWHEGWVDVVQLFQEADAFAYRAPMEPRSNPFTPAAVCWIYGSSAVWTIRAMLALPEPGTPYAPVTLIPAPPMCQTLPTIIRQVRRSVIRPPMNSHGNPQ